MGHIVAGKPGTEISYIVLARDIAKDISEQLGGEAVEMPCETEFVKEMVDEIKRTLPTPPPDSPTTRQCVQAKVGFTNPAPNTITESMHFPDSESHATSTTLPAPRQQRYQTTSNPSSWGLQAPESDTVEHYSHSSTDSLDEACIMHNRSEF
jgi:hypothetical protein